ncbi:MAG: signal peptidase I [Thermomicrobiales bacterium]
MTDEIVPVEPALTADDSQTEVATKGRSGALRETIETLLLALIIFVAVRQVVLNFRVDGSSMLPNLHNNELLLVNRHAYEGYNLASFVNWIPGVDVGDKVLHPFGEVHRGDVVVFNPPVENKPYIKRIIGLPGDVITFANNSVVINGVPLQENYDLGGLTECPTGANACKAGSITIGGNQVFVMGDNREHSQDSRFFGPIDIDSIIGKAVITYWPWSDIGRVPHYDYPSVPEAITTKGN